MSPYRQDIHDFHAAQQHASWVGRRQLHVCGNAGRRARVGGVRGAIECIQFLQGMQLQSLSCSWTGRNLGSRRCYSGRVPGMPHNGGSATGRGGGLLGRNPLTEAERRKSAPWARIDGAGWVLTAKPNRGKLLLLEHCPLTSMSWGDGCCTVDAIHSLRWAGQQSKGIGSRAHPRGVCGMRTPPPAEGQLACEQAASM